MSSVVHVRLAKRSYNITIGRGLDIGKVVKSAGGTRVLIVSDSTVDRLYGPCCERQMQAAGVAVRRVAVPAGETTKNLKWVSFLYNKALDFSMDRTAIIVALGGGVVGDLAGFTAATFLRGIRLVQVPTTLLAMVDSSVGGKTGVNLPQGKNLVGSFYQPFAVAADLDALKTLPDREYCSGLAEVVKYGVISDAGLFELLEREKSRIMKRQVKLVGEIVARCCGIKAAVVSRDERENGLRGILNFGHTLGHAVEAVDGYRTLLHGEAVSIGMAYAATVSIKEAGFPVSDCCRLVDLLVAFHLPVDVPRKRFPWSRIRHAMDADKKSRTSMPRFVLAERIGSVAVGRAVSDSVLEKSFKGVTCR